MPRSPSTTTQAKLSFRFPQRQIHLDFHTSPYIPDVGSEFDPQEFADTMRSAHVDSVTVFAKCHHGMCYYPTKTGTPHPALAGRDLLGEMVEALHRLDIRAPIYTTVAWEEDVAQRFPEWRQMKANGTFAQSSNADPTKPPHPGGWKFNDWLHPDFQDYLEAHTEEICRRYEVDGLFYDIVMYDKHAHYSEAAMKFRAKHNLLGQDDATFKRFEATAQDQFGRKFTRLLHGLKPKATIFYNAVNDVVIDSTAGARVRSMEMTHFEIESLPSGYWGYYHFPRLARYCGHWGREWLAMTGRFQRMWGDFGGVKPQAALEYECFRSQALGGANSVGDQLPPRGKLDAAAYKLIGAVYAQCAAAEPFYQNSQALPQIGILTAGFPGKNPDITNRSDEGAVQMCEESHYEATLLDELDDFKAYSLLILPDSTTVTPKLLVKLKAFYAKGGRLIISHGAGRDASGQWALNFLPLKFSGLGEKYPTFWRARRAFSPGLAISDRVVYSQGFNVIPSRGVEILVDRVEPYFQRSDLKFCSHFQTPPVAKAAKFPAVVAAGQAVYFAEPIFGEYRTEGNIVVRDVWREVMFRLVGPAPYGADLPTTVLSVPRQRGRDLIITLLHYIPLRKALMRDVLEEKMSFAGDVLRLPPTAKTVRVFGTGETLPRNSEGSFVLPVQKGRLLLEVENFFPPLSRS